MSSGPDATLTSLMHQHECLSEPLRTLLLLKLCCCLEWAHATLLPCPKDLIQHQKPLEKCFRGRFCPAIVIDRPSPERITCRSCNLIPLGLPPDLHNSAPRAKGRVPDAVPGRVASGLAQQADGSIPPCGPASCPCGRASDRGEHCVLCTYTYSTYHSKPMGFLSR